MWKLRRQDGRSKLQSSYTIGTSRKGISNDRGVQE